jgi:hypothetical protein
MDIRMVRRQIDRQWCSSSIPTIRLSIIDITGPFKCIFETLIGTIRRT